MMKTKSIILSFLMLASVGFTTTSCEDMFTEVSDLATTDLEPQDTVYQVMGIINRMQSLVDRTVLLGELRADLVDINSTTSSTLQELSNNQISSDNKYNNVADYYAVINSCNIYLAYVDTTITANNKQYYIKEYAAVKGFRAWTYLQLVLNYGSVPFVTEPVTTAEEADDIVANTSNRIDLQGVCEYFIDDLKPYVDTDLPNYGEMGGQASSSFFIPVRLMLGELYLWKGTVTGSKDDYKNACVYYHDYLDYPNKYINTTMKATKWVNSSFTFFNSVLSATEDLVIIPMDTCAYDGTYSDLAEIYNSQYKNNYNVAVNPSTRAKEISAAQTYCLYYKSDNGTVDTLYAPKEGLSDDLMIGDLRLYSNYTTMTVQDKYNSALNENRQYISKFGGMTANDGRIENFAIFRRGIVYLHFAEALNRAGFPETAFAVLKYGLSSTTMNRISTAELARLTAVTTTFGGNLSSWSNTYFYTFDGANTQNQMGIHSRGSGDSEYNAYYVLPTDDSAFDKLTAYALDSTSTAADSAAYDSVLAVIEDEMVEYRIPLVEEMILEEEALEGMFEGYRFYDLMRVALRRNDPTYLANKVAMRKGEENFDSSLYSILSDKSNWYLTLPSK